MGPEMRSGLVRSATNRESIVGRDDLVRLLHGEKAANLGISHEVWTFPGPPFVFTSRKTATKHDGLQVDVRIEPQTAP